MAKEVVDLFSLQGTLQRRDEEAAMPGTFYVVKKKDVPMSFAGRWKSEGSSVEESLGFSSASTAAEVLFAAIDQGFVPSGIIVTLDTLLTMKDHQLKDLLQAAG